jgi:hypothetical protein
MSGRAALAGVLLAMLVLGSGTASAACNNPRNWMESPASGVKVLVGYEQNLQTFASDTMDGLTSSAFAPPLPVTMLEQHGKGKLSATDGGTVSYYEPDGHGNWRICRMETWGPKRESTPAWFIKANKANQSGNPVTAALLNTYEMALSEAFLYDDKGRIVQRFLKSLKEDGASAGDYQCFRYDDKNRIVLYVRATTTHTCPTGEPDLQDFWRRFRFGESADGKSVSWWQEEHYGKDGGSWSKHVSFFAGPNVEHMSSIRYDDLTFSGGNAEVDYIKGVTKIIGGANIGTKDKSAGPTFLHSSGNVKPIEYYFPKPPVPMKVLTDLEELYHYDRRREGVATAGVLLVEYFRANEHQLRDRFYTGAGRVLRQEQFDEQGRLKRAINLGLQNLAKGIGTYYKEDLSSGHISVLLKTNRLIYRVWDYDAAGKATLVAIGWDRKLGSALTDGPVDTAPIVYGTPDGKVRWKTKEEFFKAFDFDPTAARAYPEYRHAD